MAVIGSRKIIDELADQSATNKTCTAPAIPPI
jgi:hypothetical protein